MSKKRKYLPTIEDLIDRLSIFQLKEVKIPEHKEKLCLAFDDVPSQRSYSSVAEETSQNLTKPQKDLLVWHWKLGHMGMRWLKTLMKEKTYVDADGQTQNVNPVVPTAFCNYT